MVNPPQGHADKPTAESQATSEDAGRRKAVGGAPLAVPASRPHYDPPPTPPDSLAPVTITTYSAPESGRTFVDAGPLLARATLRKELESVALTWLRLREDARGTGRDAWDGRRVSPAEIRRAEEDLERVTKKLREIA